MFTTALVTITKKWKQSINQLYFNLKKKETKRPSIEQINKMWFIHTMGYSSSIKMNEVLMHDKVNNKNIMLNERNQSQR